MAGWLRVDGFFVVGVVGGIGAVIYRYIAFVCYSIIISRVLCLLDHSISDH